MARGRGSCAPSAAHPCVYALSSSAFIGLPWPKKIAGRRVAIGQTFARTGRSANASASSAYERMRDA